MVGVIASSFPLSILVQLLLAFEVTQSSPPTKNNNKSYVLKDSDAWLFREKNKKERQDKNDRSADQLNYGIGMESRCIGGKKIR